MLFRSTMTINRTDTMVVHYPNFQLKDLIRLSPYSPVDTWVKGSTDTRLVCESAQSKFRYQYIPNKIILTEIEDEKHALNGLHAPDEELICFNLRRVFKMILKTRILLVLNNPIVALLKQNQLENFPSKRQYPDFFQ